ncbi:MAG: SHOCT domain-containing protein [Bacteroidales bacterium]|nr:SHOCT domain-containing protein [Bacteroidales bacterium]MDD3859222.1 SHOCT domain-containing protein [Bacteroidales bacterium]
MINWIIRILIFLLLVVIVYLLYKSFAPSQKDKSQSKAKANLSNSKSIADEILKLQNLKEEGIITEDEFEKMKKKLIG